MKQCIQLQHETEEEQYLDVVLQVFEVFDDMAMIDLEGVGKDAPVITELLKAILPLRRLSYSVSLFPTIIHALQPINRQGKVARQGCQCGSQNSI